MDWLYESMLGNCTFCCSLNGSSHGHFSSSRGIRQGCPLSIMIFGLGAEIFSRMVTKAQFLGLVKGFKVSNVSDEKPILQYADDTILFLDANEEMVNNMWFLILWFEFLSGLEVSGSKSKLYFINDVVDAESLNQVWSCSLGSFPDVYLGLPIGCKFKQKSV